MITDHHPDDVREQIAVLRETAYRLSNDSNATHEQHENRIAALETYRMDTNAVEARQDDDINRLKGRVGDLHEVILKLENGVKDGGLATSFVKDAWRKDINERVAANEARIKALEDRLQTVWIAPINALKERCFALDNAVDSLKLCVPTPQPPCPPEAAPDFRFACIVGSESPCHDRIEECKAGKCIYCNDGQCDYKRNRLKRPPEDPDPIVTLWQLY